MHGTTVATNAILEGKGARVALITTAGLSRRARDPAAAHAGALRHPLAQARGRSCRAGCASRSTSASTHRGERRAPLDEAAARRGDRARRWRRGVDAIAICLHQRLRQRRARGAAARADPRARPAHSGDAVQRAPARDPRVRAHQHHGRQRLRAAAGASITSSASSASSRERGDRASRSRSCSRAAAR